MHPYEFSPRRRGTHDGFTLVEMMVTMSIMAFLIAILLPVLQRVRESARDTNCKSNLRQIGQGLTQYSVRMGSYCSGAWDWKRDGAVHEVGWVADLVNQGNNVGELLCPSSPNRLSVVYHELLTTDGASNTCADSLGGPDRRLPDNTIAENPCRKIGGVSNSAARAEILNELLLKKGYNTNYAASWFLVRTDVMIDRTGALMNSKPGCQKSPRERSCTIGPMIQARIGGLKVPASIIPIMGCGMLADRGEDALTEQIGDYPIGTPLAASYTTGPREKTSLGVPQISGSGSGPSRWWGPWNATLQDYRNFGVIHGGPTGGSCNILFIDGGVQPFNDSNNDGFLNNGFPASTQTGYADDIVELPPAMIYSGWSIDPVRIP
jgi:prepilin-type N-terminal cleavage/methylation domain-containing protein/prepilin-type processing-associated H-X9-DG protein